MSIHSQNEAIILEFGLRKPAFRIVVNTPTTHGSIGLTTGLDPAMTLGCGGYGGNITSDNISPRHLLNIKRLAYEIAPAVSRFDHPAGFPARKPAAPPRTAVGISAEALSRRIDDFLGSRGFRSPTPERGPALRSGSADQGEAAGLGGNPRGNGPDGRNAGAPADPGPPLEFVCEEDVRHAIQAGRKLVISERAIVTPSARDLGEQHHVFAVGASKS
jgi:acetaldehyde dehydrogenase (acetylating)